MYAGKVNVLLANEGRVGLQIGTLDRLASLVLSVAGFDACLLAAAGQG